MRACVLYGGSAKSVDPESKASASLDRENSEATGGVPSKALMTALPTGKSTSAVGHAGLE